MAPDSSKLLRVYRKIKIVLNRWMDDIIRLCNVFLHKTEKIQSAGLRYFLQRSALWVGNFALLQRQLPRSDAFELTGPLGKVVLVGQESSIPSFTKNMFGTSEMRVEHIGRYSLWSLPAQTDQWFSEGAQMVAVSVSPLYRKKFHSAYILEVPYLIRQVMPIQEPLDSILASSKFRNIRKNLNKTLRLGIESKFSREKDDFDLFYHRMYLPYTADRHGDWALFNRYEDLWNYFSAGGLLMFYLGSEPVAGSLVMTRGNAGFGIVGGVLDGNQDLLRSGIYTMIVWETAKWSKSQGMTYLDLGTSNPLRSDGVFYFKKSFGAKVERCYNRNGVNQIFIHSDWTILMDAPSLEFIKCINDTGLIVEKNSKFYGAVLDGGDQENTTETWADELKHASEDGLSGLAFFKPHQVVCLDAFDEANISDERK